MAICKECGARINKQAKFCSNCGCPVNAKESGSVNNNVEENKEFCEFCGALITSGVRTWYKTDIYFCPQCGKHLNNGKDNKKTFFYGSVDFDMSFCENCGKRINVWANHCVQCGADFDRMGDSMIEAYKNGNIAFCPDCGAMVNKDATFCVNCGHCLNLKGVYYTGREKSMYCEGCGGFLNKADNFCYHCGKLVDNEKLEKIYKKLKGK